MIKGLLPTAVITGVTGGGDFEITQQNFVKSSLVEEYCFGAPVFQLISISMPPYFSFSLLSVKGFVFNC